MDLIEQEPRDPPSPLAVLAAACALTLGTGVAAAVRHHPVAADRGSASRPVPSVADENWAGPRRVPAALLPPGRPRRNSPAQIAAQAPEVPRLGSVGTGRAPGRVVAQNAAYAMAARLCRDPSLTRLRVLRRDDDWSAVTYYVRVYEDPPAHGSFALSLRWTGRDYAYTVTGKSGDCRDRGTG